MKPYFRFSLLAIILFIIPILFLKTQPVESVPPKNVKDIISNSQLSYYGGVAVGTSANDSLIKIDTGTSFPSRTSNNLFVGDTISIGIGGSQSTYTVKDVGNTASIMINVGISAVSSVAGGSIIATRSAIHSVYFEPQVNSTGGIWQFLIKATSGVAAEKTSDAIPDQLGFDLGTLNAGAVGCPYGATASVGTTTAVALGSPAVTSYYHVVQCAMAAGVTNPTGVGAGTTMTIGVGNSMLINPSPSHSAVLEGNADIFTFIVRHLDSGSLLLDQTVGKIAVVESVRVTATVDPVLTFTIDSVNTNTVGSTACGAGTSLSTTATQTTGDRVVFGSLAIGTTGNQLGQRLSCITNALGGYVVTAYESAVMKNINTATTIPDTACNVGGCTTTSATAWAAASAARSEFGYTMTNIGSSIPFVPGNFKPFGIGVANAQEIMKRTALPTTTESANVCYRITATTSQEAGDYEAKIVYTATATF